MFEAANNLIETRLKAQWGSTTAIDWDNVEFRPVIGTPFIRLLIDWTDNNSISIGGLDRGEGYINISIFETANKGTKHVTSMADSLSAIFRKWSSGGLQFRVPRIITIGKQEEWYRLDVIIPFKYDECNTPPV
jgi:hypothetical protein